MCDQSHSRCGDPSSNKYSLKQFVSAFIKDSLRTTGPVHDEGLACAKQPLLLKDTSNSCPCERHSGERRPLQGDDVLLKGVNTQGSSNSDVFSLHAVIGEGSVGRIQVASLKPRSGECSDLGDEQRALLGKGGSERSMEGHSLSAWSTTTRRDEWWYTPAWLTEVGGLSNGRSEDWGIRRRRRWHPTPPLCVLKSMCKRKITERGQARHVEAELRVLQLCSHPFVVSLHQGGHFQTSGHLHLVLDYCPGGDLFSLLAREGCLSEDRTKVYAAELVLALEHLHQRNIAYRDLKPENVCLDAQGHIVLVDFSLSRLDMDKAPGGKAHTFCGSEAYVAPEMLNRKGHDSRVDLWALGCVLFEALTGTHPFRRHRKGGHSENKQKMFEDIVNGSVEYPTLLSVSQSFQYLT
ncbi:unnamed protein product [Choristocarpus tenellus]